ncbi:MAG TPA: FkbM family methyltransferase [Tepidisphaeraceae bacterium]|nr:FkbM family methyltransferase [Tepidisphaeraceae bacterium]
MPTIRQQFLATMMHYYPFYSGCGSIMNTPLLRAAAGSGEGLAWARLRCGGRLLVPLNDYVGRAAFYTGDLDPKLSWVCSRLVRRGDTVLDIGANLGLVTLRLSALVGSGGRVHAFEPNPLMIELLERSVQRHHLQNVTVHPVALGEKEAELDLHVPANHAGQASLRDKARGERVRVPVKRLASIPDLPMNRPIRFMKIDVEGYEPEVLRGAEELLKNNPPQAIVFELNHFESFMSHPTVQILASHGYAFFALPKRWLRMRATPADGMTNAPGHDFVAVHRGPNYEQMMRALL